MNANTYARTMATYNAWMNEKLYSCASELADEERKRDMGAFFGSIHLTLNHIYVVDEAWMQRFGGEAVSMKSAREERFTDFGALWTARQSLDTRIAAWADALSDTFSDSPFRLFSVAYQRDMELPGHVVLLQLFNHQAHHRGQVTTLLKQLGKDPGPTDLPMLPGMMTTAGQSS